MVPTEGDRPDTTRRAGLRAARAARQKNCFAAEEFVKHRRLLDGADWPAIYYLPINFDVPPTVYQPNSFLLSTILNRHQTDRFATVVLTS